MEKTKPFVIPKMQVVQAYKLVKANAGAAGVDKETLDDFEQKRKDNLSNIAYIPVLKDEVLRYI